MSYLLREVGLEFLKSAPVRLMCSGEVSAPRPAVFKAVTADPASWSWFPGVSGGAYHGPGPYGVGSGREVKATGVRYIETVMEWDEPARWAYRINETSLPVARALIEGWEFEEVGGRNDCTSVRWTFAIDPRLSYRIMMSFGRPVIAWVFRRAMRNLSIELGQRAS